MKIEEFLGSKILNIFCDASTRKRGKITDACYGAVAVCDNREIDKIYRICSDSSNNLAEIRAVRAAICLAIRHQSEYDIINIFSDSQISIFGIRDRYFTWRLKKDKLFGFGNTMIANQDVFIEIMELICSHNLEITFYHQNGHVNCNNPDSMKEATHVFMASNGIRECVDMNLIRYISYWNDIVDKKSRQILLSTNIYKLNIISPVKFNAVNFYSQLNQYYNIQTKKGEQKYENEG